MPRVRPSSIRQRRSQRRSTVVSTLAAAGSAHAQFSLPRGRGRGGVRGGGGSSTRGSSRGSGSRGRGPRTRAPRRARSTTPPTSTEEQQPPAEEQDDSAQNDSDPSTDSEYLMSLIRTAVQQALASSGAQQGTELPPTGGRPGHSPQVSLPSSSSPGTSLYTHE